MASGIRNPVFEAIGAMGLASRTMSAASNTMAQVRQSFNKGASLVLKMDRLLAEEEARKANEVMKASQMLNSSINSALNTVFRQQSMDLQQQQFNAQEKAREFNRDIQLANYGLKAGKEARQDDFYTFNKEKSMLGLIPKTTRSVVGGQVIEAPNPSYTDAVNSFINKWGQKFDLSVPRVDAQKPLMPEANTGTVQADNTVRPANTTPMPKPGDTSASAPSTLATAVAEKVDGWQAIPMYQGDQPSDFKEANMVLGQAVTGQVALDDATKESIRTIYKSQMPKYPIDDELAKLDKIGTSSIPAVQSQTVVEPMTKSIRDRRTNAYKLAPSKRLIEINGQAVPDSVTFVVNGKPQTEPTIVTLDKNGKPTTQDRSAAFVMENPAVLVLGNKNEDVFTAIADGLSKMDNQRLPETAKSTFKQQALDAIAKYRPEVLIDPNVASDIATMIGGALSKENINQVVTTIARNGHKPQADKIGKFLTNMSKYRGFDNKLPEDKDNVVDGFVDKAAAYSFNPTWLADFFRTDVTSLATVPDRSEIMFDPAGLRTGIKNTITNEYKHNGYSPTFVKVDAANRILRSKDYDKYMGESRVNTMPHEIIRDDLERQGFDDQKINPLLYTLFGPNRNKYRSPETMKAMSKMDQELVNKYGDRTYDFVQSIARQLAANAETAQADRGKITAMAGDIPITLSTRAARELVGWLYLGTIERDE